MATPIIGISTCYAQQGMFNYHQTGEKYIAAIINAIDGFPILIPALADKLDHEKLFSTIDGILLTGSYSNVEPHRYNGPASKPDTKHDPRRDATFLPLILAAVEAEIPLFAICRGFQEMNVAFEGSLHQEVHKVAEKLDHREDESQDVDGQYDFSHSVTLTENGVLSQLTDEKAPMVNSVHWQGIDKLGQGLQPEAVAPDGLIEAFSVKNAKTFALGVQWHPEWKVMEIPFYKVIFETFGKACTERANSR
ncbi:MAG TPA: gamma-glutamyl-gamma-aminobutyrate hydrolase family protein [Candidatus Marinimicrobia bacterium]|nr:gamma-glutamyl-gamma-aminobutyrate hydrolase [Candidatus Neomarinimicrobiota bacterium]MDP6275665.1 gamma-glutamyl-gamma-aminobutyrate hydrolase family protein [Candidatus Neomarinimicrobiota bacterium]MDP7216814.1 gamma-glutamyl-gamma-aminobutyrate hydrolase family protein [Candidatus Neomarinimicrobiota bacterium]MDP7437625.1 gamma-glutamyl-gamma-aminobutyrate hydrolase family protein [Candidatus Neomarinimicrobiota bacterium]HJL75443.1 gamma-glutamyl-gamma-aminobutyrate hydrolase family p|tara:strand:+ start:870 stop:1619 length:750 start_codon:yes stop_codon:yes gene_type:complete